ncbi:MAG: hypothetical protein AAF721_08560 [Myxococcota bacterium]
MAERLETDYLVVGSGASGMAFVDEIVTHSDATVAIVDRRHAPGGHWVDAYPFVRLHQPSAFYGVSSTALGGDQVDTAGHNAGFYELAGPDELCAYYERVMHRRFLPSGRVRHFPNCHYEGDGRFSSCLTGKSWAADVRMRVVDTTYAEGTIPATSPPPFELADGVRCVPVGAITRVDETPDGFVVVGGGKTALDACVWLLERGVPAGSITWIKPREAWWLNRKFQQPHHLLPDLYLGAALQIEAMAKADSPAGLLTALEDAGVFVRIDPRVTPTMFRAAIVSEREVAMLRTIENVVRMGRVRRIEPDRIVLDDGDVPTTPNTLHVHCAAQALPRRPLRPIFEPGLITIQMVRWGFSPMQAALIGFVETAASDDDEKNRLCPPFSNLDTDTQFVEAFSTSMTGDRARSEHPAVDRFVKSTRLNPGSGIRSHLDDPKVQRAHGLIKANAAAAMKNLKRLASRPAPGRSA